MKEKMWEDMFTPEGVPMTSPHNAGMKGRGDGWHGKTKPPVQNKPVKNKSWTPEKQ